MINDVEVLPLQNPGEFLDISKYEPLDHERPFYTYSNGHDDEMQGPFFIGSNAIKPLNQNEADLASQLLGRLINGAYKIAHRQNLLSIRVPRGPIYKVALDFSSISSSNVYNHPTMKFIAGCKQDPLFQRILIYMDEVNIEVETLSTWHLIYGCIEIFEKKLLKSQWNKAFATERAKLGNTANNIGFPLGRHSVAHSKINMNKMISPKEGIEIIEMLSKEYLGI